MKESIVKVLWALTEMEAAILHLQATIDDERVKLRTVIDAARAEGEL